MFEFIFLGVFLLAVILLLISVVLVMYFHIENIKKEIEQRKVDEALRIKEEQEKSKEPDIRTVIVPDNVDVDESSTVSTQDIDAKKYTIDMNEVRGKLDKNVVKDGKVSEDFKSNKEPLEEIVDIFKNTNANNDDDDPIKKPGNPIKNLLNNNED